MILARAVSAGNGLTLAQICHDSVCVILNHSWNLLEFTSGDHFLGACYGVIIVNQLRIMPDVQWTGAAAPSAPQAESTSWPILAFASSNFMTRELTVMVHSCWIHNCGKGLISLCVFDVLPNIIKVAISHTALLGG